MLSLSFLALARPTIPLCWPLLFSSARSRNPLPGAVINPCLSAVLPVEDQVQRLQVLVSLYDVLFISCMEMLRAFDTNADRTACSFEE